MHARTHAHTRTHARTHARARTHTHTHTNTHTQTHTHTHLDEVARMIPQDGLQQLEPKGQLQLQGGDKPGRGVAIGQEADILPED